MTSSSHREDAPLSLEGELLELATELDRTITSADPAPSAAERIRSLLHKHRPTTQYGVSWCGNPIAPTGSLDEAAVRLGKDNRYYRNSKLFSRTITPWTLNDSAAQDSREAAQVQ